MRKALNILSILDDRDIEWMIEHGEVRQARKGLTVIREGEPIDSLSIVLDGKLSIIKGASTQPEIASLYAGDIVGEISFVDSRPPSASAVVTEDARIFVIPAMALRNKLDRDTAFAARFYRAVARFLADRLRTTTGHLGYGKRAEQEFEEADLEELDEAALGDVSLAARRFDDMLKRLQMV